ncbi:MAG: DUF4331 domain-containing protein, partial [Actinomycetota bacterium]|nr:DUF4331 domain-containing protein [Actinomycetota bacterium]
MLGATTGVASSHREAPNILNDPKADNTDVYAFVSPDAPDTVTLLANWYPLQEPDGGPNFYPFAEDARYTIKIDNNGDAVPDITYRWEFSTQDLRPEVQYEDAADGTFLYNNGPVESLTDENLLFRQTYTLTEVTADGERVLVQDAPAAPDNVGPASMPNYAALRQEAIIPLPEGGKTFAGQADDPFFLDLRIFALLYGGDLSERGIDTLDGYNVKTIGIQVPKTALVSEGEPVIGVWSTTERPSTMTINPDGTTERSGDFVQVSRLGNPLVNEVVLPVGLKDAFNSLEPENDASVQAAVDRVLEPEVPQLVEAIYGIPAPEGPRDDLFTIFLTGLKGLNQPANVTPAELLRLNTSIPPTAEANPLGVLGGDTAGFPNGRRLTDDVVDIGLQALEGAVTVDARGGAATGVSIVEPLAEGDRVSSNDVPFSRSFPYVALPHGIAVNAGVDVSTSPAGGVAAGGGGTTLAAPDARSTTS